MAFWAPRPEAVTSQRVSQTALWELANYTLKPRLNRATGVSSVVVQGGQVPEFRVEPDPAKLIESVRGRVGLF